MWTRIDLPRARLFSPGQPDAGESRMCFDGYDFRVESLGGDPPPRFRLTVRLRAPQGAGPLQMCWSECYEDEQAACCSVVRIIGAMPEA